MSINLVGFMGADSSILQQFIDNAVADAEAQKSSNPGAFAAKFSQYLEVIEADDPDGQENIQDGIQDEGDAFDRPDDDGSIGGDAGGDTDFDNLRGDRNGGNPGDNGTIGIEGDGSNRSGSVLTEEELNIVKGEAILQFNTVMMTNRSMYKANKKQTKERKEDRKRVEAEDLAYAAKMAAKRRAENNRNKKKA